MKLTITYLVNIGPYVGTLETQRGLSIEEYKEASAWLWALNIR